MLDDYSDFDKFFRGGIYAGHAEIPRWARCHNDADRALKERDMELDKAIREAERGLGRTRAWAEKVKHEGKN